ncbi:MAG: ornithine cyclodeaminase family protein, partial [Acidobacteriia bacterium]|nr:ornithine cyclodeaminase family protein [Terriglobia bacterium]
ALAAVVTVEVARVWSRSAAKREAFAGETAERLGIRVEPAASAEEAVEGADIIVTPTNSAEPVLEAGWVASGAHVNAMGSNQPRRREVPAELLRRAGLIAVDSLEQSRMESGDLILGLSEREWAAVVELKDVVAGRVSRRSADEITLFKSNGLAVEDVAAAGWVYERAVAAGAGKPAYS